MAQHVDAWRWTQAILQSPGRRHAQPGASLADDEGRDDDVHPVDQFCCEKSGNGQAAAFHEDASHSARPELGEQCVKVQLAGGGVDLEIFDVGRSALLRQRDAASPDTPCRSCAISEYFVADRKSQPWIEHDAHWIRAADEPGGEAWIVGRHGAGADDHAVAESPQTMQMGNALRASHEVRVPIRRGDATIEALAELGEYEGRMYMGPEQWEI